MKTSVFLLLAGDLCLSAYGQGYVNFANFAGGLNAPVLFSDGTTKVSGPCVAQLRGGPDTLTLPYLGSPTRFLSGGGAGYFSGGAVVIPGVPGGGVAWVQVVVWDPTLGGTATAASADQAYAYSVSTGLPAWGSSAVFSAVTGDPTSSPPSPPTTLSNLTSIIMGCLDCNVRFFGFTTQPQSQTVNPGTSVSFTAMASAYPPPFYQWFYNGASLPGATQPSYQLANVQPTNAGNYWAVLSGPWGTRTSDIATLTVQSLPSILAGPLTHTAEAGTSTSFAVNATGVPIPNYQWFFNSAPVNGATQSVLLLANLQSANSGLYSVAATNNAGAVTSPPAGLNVIAPIARQAIPTVLLNGEVGTAVNLEGLETPGSGNWQLLSSLTVTSSPQLYFDFNGTPAQRFYRTTQPAGAMAPSLEMQMVPNLTLTAAPNHVIALQGINTVGPTNAWYTVDIVYFTNAGQTYLDISTIHQPPRLWRIIPWP